MSEHSTRSKGPRSRSSSGSAQSTAAVSSSTPFSSALRLTRLSASMSPSVAITSAPPPAPPLPGIPSPHPTPAPRRADARDPAPAAKLDHAQPTEVLAIELPGQGHPAPPEHRPVRRKRGPFDLMVVGDLRRFRRLEHAKLAARQLDGVGDEFLGHRPTLC